MGRLSGFSRTIFDALLAATCLAATAHAAEPTGYTIGLSPGARSRGLAEATTAADFAGADSLFYNPALMARSPFHLGVGGASVVADRDSTKLAEAAQRDGGDVDPLATVADKLSSERPTYAGTNVRLLDIVTPFAGVMGFGGASLYSQHDEELGRHSAQLNADAGAIAGVAAKWGPLSIGYSQYWLNRAGFGLDVDTPTRDAIIAATASGPLTPGQFSYNDFSTAEFGGATGGNAGLVLRPFDGNISQIGVAVLNVGGVKFSDKSAYGNQSTANKLSGSLHDQAALYGIEVGTPADLPELVNAGMQLGVGTEDDGGKSTTWHVAMLADYDDIAGDVIEHKFAAGAVAGISVSDKLALATGVPVMPLSEEYKEAYLHVGLKAVEFYGGYRPGEYATGGAKLQFHIGVSNRFSPLYLEIEAFSLTAEPEGSYVSTMGVSAALAGALIF